MHGETVPSSIAAAALSACAIEPEILNSERIEERFGNYGLEVLSNQPGLRRSALFSRDGNDKTCRTYAVVRFVGTPDTLIDAEHEQVLAGDSIGAIFKAGGWTIRKETLYLGTVDLHHSDSDIAAVMRIEMPCKIAMHVYHLLLQKNGVAFDYATISEFHHPDYLDLADLRMLYPVDSNKQLLTQQVEELLSLSLDKA
jgi:hypothetical protein